MTDDEVPIVERGLLSMSDAAWDQTARQAAVIAPMAGLDVVGHGAANAAAAQLGVSRRQVYVLIDRYRRGSGKVTDLVPGRSGGGRGEGRLSAPVEAVIEELIRTRYLKRQQLSLAVVHRDIVRACSEDGLPAPARSTVARRVAVLHPGTVTRRRQGAAAVRALQATGGLVPEISAPLEQVQIDHTVIDLIIVDERDRQPVGRPYDRGDRFLQPLPGGDGGDLRPIHHYTETRVRAHVFICMLAAYLIWHLRQAWAPLTFTDEHRPDPADPVAPAKRSTAAEAKASTRTTATAKPVYSFQSLLTHPGTLTRNQIHINGTGTNFELVTTPTTIQRRAFELIGQPILTILGGK